MPGAPGADRRGGPGLPPRSEGDYPIRVMRPRRPRPLLALLSLVALCLPACPKLERPGGPDVGPGGGPRGASVRPVIPPGRVPNVPEAELGWSWVRGDEREPPRSDPHHTELHLVLSGKTEDYFYRLVMEKRAHGSDIGVGPTVEVHRSREPKPGVKPSWRHAVRCERAFRLAPEGKLDGAMARPDPASRLLVVACFPRLARGYQVHALEATSGKVRWMVEVRPYALPPGSHGDSFEQSLQLELRGQRVLVHGLNAVAPFVDVLDARSGRVLQSGAPPPRLTRLTFGARGERPARSLPRGVRVRVVKGKTSAEVQRLAGKRTEWRTQLDEPFRGAAATLVRDQLLYVAHYSPIATGVKIYALAMEGGKLQWKRTPRGLGPIEHSGYRNKVELSHIEGHLVVRGEESSGRYVEVLDPRTGRPVAAQQWF